ncbi:Trihelix transcription factor ENAP2-like protein, partial [Drosera capensis]
METLIAPTPRPRLPPPPPPQPPRPFPSRDDLWSEPATFILIKAWANHRHIARSNQIHHNNDGAHRQSHWKLVADAVNAVHGHSKKSRRTDVQCKNRIDTIKKKYKAELARIKRRDGEGGDYVSPWPFFDLFHSVVSKEEKEKEREKKGVVVKRKRSRSRSESPMTTVKTPLIPIPIPIRGPRTAMSKRPAAVDGSFFRRNFDAAAAVKSGESDGDDEEEERGNGGSETEETIRGEEEGCRELARALTRFGEVYERVEVMKQERLVELEKQRMQFLKDLEYQRMKLLMDTHWFGRRKRAKGSDDADVVNGVIKGRSPDELLVFGFGGVASVA